MVGQTCAARSVDFPVFLVVSESQSEHIGTDSSTTRSKGTVTVLASRAKAGLGGMITISALLLTIQFITGVQAFPL
jgi:hypothetical protein